MVNFGGRWNHQRTKRLSLGPWPRDDGAAGRFDREVDVLCVGSGPAVLAAAISAADTGMEVLVAAHSYAPKRALRTSLPTSWAVILRSVWGLEELPDATMAYLRGLTDDVSPPDPSLKLDALNFRHVDEPTTGSPRSSGTVAPFFGAALLPWSRACLSAPYGLLYSGVSIPGAKEFVQESGERLEVSTLGPHPRHRIETSLSAWMVMQARERGVEVCAVGSLQQLIFDDHDVVGAVLGEGPGSLAVHTRQGVALCTSHRGTEDSALRKAWQSTNSQLGLVSAVASRFGRLELLTNQASRCTLPVGHYRSSRKMIPS